MVSGNKLVRPDAGADDGPLAQAREARLAENARHALLELRDCVDADPAVLGGAAVLRGTRFSIAQLLAEIADGRGPDEVAEAFALDREQIGRFLHGLALYLDRPVAP